MSILVAGTVNGVPVTAAHVRISSYSGSKADGYSAVIKAYFNTDAFTSGARPIDIYNIWIPYAAGDPYALIYAYLTSVTYVAQTVTQNPAPAPAPAPAPDSPADSAPDSEPSSDTPAT